MLSETMRRRSRNLAYMLCMTPSMAAETAKSVPPSARWFIPISETEASTTPKTMGMSARYVGVEKVDR
jgi:hypothetical protein